MEKTADINAYLDLHKSACDDPAKFWAEYWMPKVSWIKQPTKIMDDSNPPFIRWFTDGTLNFAYNCIERHLTKGPDRTALIYESPVTGRSGRMSYGELHIQVERFSTVLANKGVQSGDRVVIYMPMILESAVVMLACARIGAVISVVFGGFAAKELASRIKDCDPKIIVSASCGIEPHKVIDYRKLIDEAKSILVAAGDLESEKALPAIYFEREQKKIENWRDFEFRYQDLMNQVGSIVARAEVDSTHPLYILYTSGTTGQPKGIYRDSGGTVAGLMSSLYYAYGFNEDSIMFATSDIGWVVGHSYLTYGPLLFGGQTIFYEGKPVGTPDCTAYFRVIQKHKVSVFYTSPTAMRAIRREDPEAKTILPFDRSSIQVWGCVGERTDVHTFDLIDRLMPKGCLYNDTYWQTETGWYISANFFTPYRFPSKAGSCTKPYPGYDVRIMSDEGEEITKPNVLGNVVTKLPTPPSFMLSLWNNDKFFIEKYFSQFPGYYCTGDAGYFDEEGYLNVTSRTDDIINVAGHRLSTSQMEEAVLINQALSAAIVVGVKDALKGQRPFGLVVLKDGAELPKGEEGLIKEIITTVRKEIGPVAFFKSCIVVDKLPKTRSGKILRGIVRRIIDGEEYKFPATIEDASALGHIEEKIKEFKINLGGDISFGDKAEIEKQKKNMNPE